MLSVGARIAKEARMPSSELQATGLTKKNGRCTVQRIEGPRQTLLCERLWVNGHLLIAAMSYNCSTWC